MGKMHLIAENNESGEVIWLWRWDGSNSRPRPLRAETLGKLPVANAVVHGASRAAVSKWLKAQHG